MSDELKFPDSAARADRDSLPESLNGIIRDAYAPPAGPGGAEAYWAGLEQRIMARIAAEGAGDGRWWTVLAPWARAGLVAAAAIFALAGVINERLGDAESQLAYESVVEATTPEVLSTSEELLTVQSGPDNDGAALRYFLSH
ncbi:MAG: hypothetical protein Q7S20_06575 [Gemmatimonadaceae bacterium]|nr:hypothetical protein [Gemmatimonadaceae bacterium]